jgi:hypothetical protein
MHGQINGWLGQMVGWLIEWVEGQADGQMERGQMGGWLLWPWSDHLLWL